MSFSSEIWLKNRDIVYVRAPLRISFFGGGSDLQSYSDLHPGMVVTGAIDRYIDIVLRKRQDHKIRVLTNTLEVVDDPATLANPIIREALNYVAPAYGFDLSILSDVTRAGSGLGSSSALIVGMLTAFDRMQRTVRSPAKVAEVAAHIEIDLCKRNIGKQDFYPAAFGGLRAVRFQLDGRVDVDESLLLSPGAAELQGSMLLTDTGLRRDASAVLAHQRKSVSEASQVEILGRMVELAREFESLLKTSTKTVLADLFEESWRLKSLLSGGLPSKILEIYDAGKSAGALGAKLLGAGAGGHLLWAAPKETHPRIMQALSGLKTSPVALVEGGVRSVTSDLE